MRERVRLTSNVHQTIEGDAEHFVDGVHILLPKELGSGESEPSLQVLMVGISDRYKEQIEG